MEKVKVAVIGLGAISGIYLDNITRTFSGLEVVGVCDIVPERAENVRQEYAISKVYPDIEAALADSQVELILNLTRPSEHMKVGLAALEAGKHVYSEKPLGATLEEGEALSAAAQRKGLYLGCAPDTFLGSGIQTCRKLIDDGFIGRPVGATASMICRGHEGWHPAPEFYYQYGGGPMMDMGPYYLTALINLLGGVKSLCGVAKTSFPTRRITSEPNCGKLIQVEAPTYISGLMEFESGVTANIFTTFDVVYETQARLEIYGESGTLIVPDPNTFGGPVKLLRRDGQEPHEIPLLFDYDNNSRGLGLADMAAAIRSGRPARADWQQALHVLEIMTSIEKSGKTKEWIDLQTRYIRRDPMDYDCRHWDLQSR